MREAAEHEVAPEQASALAPAVAPALGPALAPGMAPSVANVLALQRSAGNRAVSQMLSRKLGPDSSGTVNEHIEEQLVNKSSKGETSFHWDAKFGYEFWSDQINVWVNVRMDDSAVGEDVGRDVRQRAERKFREVWNKKYDVVESGWFGDTRVLSMGLSFIQSEMSDEPIHAYITLLPGTADADSGTNRGTWHVNDGETTWAHEPGHLFGLLDEYADPNVVGREDNNARGVHEDNSIMGAYPIEGEDKAAMKDRHALRIAKMVYKADKRDKTITVKRHKD